MDEQIILERLAQQVRNYALHRTRDASKGLETPRLAALLVEKYGRGVADTVATIFDNPSSTDFISKIVDKETAKLDPLWREHARERWAGRPSDVVAHG